MERLKVLHIEDNYVEREALSIALKKENNLIMVGSTGKAHEGLLMVKQYLPEVVILDLELKYGTEDGFYFLDGLKN